MHQAKPLRLNTPSLADIPTELQIQILSYLSLQDQIKASQVCKLWDILYRSRSIRRGRYPFERAIKGDEIYQLAGIHQLFHNSIVEVTVSKRTIESVAVTDVWMKSRHDVTHSPFLDDELFYPFHKHLSPANDRLKTLNFLKSRFTVSPWPGERYVHKGKQDIWRHPDLQKVGGDSASIRDFLDWLIHRALEYNWRRYKISQDGSFIFYICLTSGVGHIYDRSRLEISHVASKYAF